MPEVQATVKTDPTTGAVVMGANNQPILVINGKERELGDFVAAHTKLESDLDTQRAKLARLGTLEQQIASLGEYGDPVKLKALRDEAQSLKDKVAAGEAGATDEKINEEVQRRYGRSLAEANTARETAEKEARTNAEAKTLAERQRDETVIENALNFALASTPDFMATPISLRAMSLLVREEWDVENGKPVKYQKPHDPNSGVVMGADKTPLKMPEWILSLRPEGGNFFRATADGGNASGTSGRKHGDKVMTRTEFEALSPAEQSKRSIEGWTLTD